MRSRAPFAFLLFVFGPLAFVPASCGDDASTTTTSTGPTSTGAAGSAGGAAGSGGSAGASTTSGAGGSTAGSAGTAGRGGAAGTGGQGTGGTGGSGGQGTAGSGGQGTGGAGGQGTGGTGGAGGSPSDGGSDGAVPGCTPGTGTMDVGAKSILDKATCLTWTKSNSGSNMTNKQAAKYCDTLDQDGISDWRVPAPEELVTWPKLAVGDSAYITNPTYIPNNSASEQEGCTSNSHSCNISQYSAGKIACGWQGVGFQGPTVCVRGTAAPGTTKGEFAATSCTECKSHLVSGADGFKAANCLPYAY